MLKKEELITGECYVNSYGNIFIWGIGDSTHYLGNSATEYHKGGGFFDGAQRLATIEECWWLETCITIGDYIEFERAMGTFRTPKPDADKDLDIIYKKLLNV